MHSSAVIFTAMKTNSVLINNLTIRGKKKEEGGGVDQILSFVVQHADHIYVKLFLLN